MSLMVTFSYLEALLTSANLMSVEVADNFLPLNFLTPSFKGFRSCLTFSNFHATLGRKRGTLIIMSSLSSKVNFLGKGMSKLISNLSPYPIWKFMQEIPSHRLWCCL